MECSTETLETAAEKYPQIDSELRKKIEDIRRIQQKSNIEFNSFDREIIWYGIDAVFHVHFISDALEVAENRMKLDDFVERYDLHKEDQSRRKFIASMRPAEEAGIYLPPQRENRQIELFSEDYLNKCGFPESIFRIPPKAATEILRRKWNLEDFKNPELLRKAMTLAKDMWAISVVGFEIAVTQKHDCQPVPAATLEISSQLIDYYWQIIEAAKNDEEQLFQWLIYRREKEEWMKKERPPQVFIGPRRELNNALRYHPNIAEYKVKHEILNILKSITRRQLADELIGLDIIY